MRYQNFDLWIDNKTGDGYPLRAASPVFGETRDILQLEPAYLDEIEQDIDKLAQRETDRDFLIYFGTRLYEHLFKGKIESLFEQSYGDVSGDPGAAIRLRLRIEAPEIAALPWEFLYSPVTDCFLGTLVRSSLVRYLEIFQRIRSLEAKLPLRILVAIPESVAPYPPIDADTEKSNLIHALEGLEDSVQVTFLDGYVTRTQISDALLEESYHCFHYIGHGDFQDEQGFLLLNADNGTIDFVDEQQFASLFRNHATMKLVVLNSCKGAQLSYTKPLVGMAPQLVKLGIPAVVAMQYAIADEAAVLFAREFYRSLFKGKNRGRVEVAMSHARNRLAGKFPDDRDIGAPVLFMRAWEGVLFNPVKGKLLKDIPLSREELHTAQAVTETLEHNLTIEPGNEEVNRNDRKELQRLKQRIKVRNYTLIATSCIVLGMFCLSLVGIFNVFGLDTRIESLTMWLGDMFIEKTFSDQIVTVYLSNETMEHFKSFGDKRWRQGFAKLVKTLSQFEVGAKVIVFDLSFVGQSRFDQEFIDAIREARNRGIPVIFGVRDSQGDKPNIEEKFKEVITGFGATCIGGKLGWARTAPLAIIKENNDDIFSLALKTIEAYKDETYASAVDVKLDLRQIVLRSEKTENLIEFGFSELTWISEDQEQCSVIQKENKVVDIILDLSPLKSMRGRQYEYNDVIRFTRDGFKRFDQRIVLVGVQSDGDIHPVYQGFQKENRYGFELHADAINTILQPVNIRPMGEGDQLLIMICLGVLGAFIRYRTSHVRQYWRIAFCIGLSVVYVTGTIYLYSQYRMLLNMLYHVGTFWLTYWTVGKLERRYLP
jgi:CHASE2 domain-containing sensor protein